MENTLQIDGRLLTNNWSMNLAGQILPIIVALSTIPISYADSDRAIRHLVICWIFLGSSGIFDLGLGRATTKFVAEWLGRGEKDKVPGLIWTSLLTQTAIGIGAALVWRRDDSHWHGAAAEHFAAVYRRSAD